MLSSLVDYAPTEWGAQVNYDRWDDDRWLPDKWVIHWGGGANSGGRSPYSVDAEQAQLRSWERFHLSKGWRGIAYNYAIGQTGSIYRLRGENESGATSGDYEGDGIPENKEARAVVFILGEGQPPTDAALRAFSSLWRQDQKLVIGHDDVKGPGYTACPGPELMEWYRAEGYKNETQPPVSEPEGEDIVKSLPILGPREKRHGYDSGVPELNEDVQRLQGLLVAANVAPSDPYSLSSKGFDGKFGAGTGGAVRSFQKKFGLKQDEIVGEVTWSHLLGVAD